MSATKIEAPRGVQVMQALAVIPSAGNTIDAVVEHGAAIAKAADDVRDLIEQVEGLKITDAAGSARVTELLAHVAATQERIDEARLAITKPLKARAKGVEDAVRPLTTALEALTTAGKRKLSEWIVAERRRVEEETRKREEEMAARRRAAEEAERAAAHARADELKAAAEEKRPVDIMAMMPNRQIVAEAPPAVAPAPRGVKTEYGSATSRTVTDFEIVNVQDVPRDYMVPDLAKIRAAVQANPDVVIFGVRVFQREEIAVRARR